MLLHNYLLFRNAPHLIVASSIVFLALNFFENTIHYNIGAQHTDLQHMVVPKDEDLSRMILTMLIFAVLQGLCTALFVHYI